MGAWTQEDVDRHNAKFDAKMPAHVPAPQKSKYKNVKVEVDGFKFDSKGEAAYWQELKLREKAGEIECLDRQYVWPLMCPTHNQPGMTSVVANYVCDFTYIDKPSDGSRGDLHVVDFKGHRTREYLLKRKWLELQEGIAIEEV